MVSVTESSIFQSGRSWKAGINYVMVGERLKGVIFVEISRN